MDLKLTGHTCACGGILVMNYQWRHLTPEQRAEAQAAGYARASNQQLCHRCACAASKRRTPQQRRKRRVAREERYTTAEALVEWYHLRDRNLSVRENCDNIAPRMGLRPKSLERHLNRAGIYADDLQVAA